MRTPSWTRHLKQHPWRQSWRRHQPKLWLGLQSGARLGYRSLRKVVIAIVGSVVLLIGIAMVVLPGPAMVVIPAGLAILALEFPFAQRWLDQAHAFLSKQWQRWRHFRRQRRMR